MNTALASDHASFMFQKEFFRKNKKANEKPKVEKEKKEKSVYCKCI